MTFTSAVSPVVQSWVIHTRLHHWDACDLPGHLTSEERTRMKRYRHKEDQLRFALGRHLLRQAAAALWDVGSATIQVDVGPAGQPHLRCGQLDFFCSVSHAGNWVAVALGTVPVGLDLEPLQPHPAADLLPAFGTEDQQVLLTEPDCALRLRMWCARESLLKLLGCGFSQEVQAAVHRIRHQNSCTLQAEGQTCTLQVLPLDDQHSMVFASCTTCVPQQVHHPGPHHGLQSRSDLSLQVRPSFQSIAL